MIDQILARYLYCLANYDYFQLKFHYKVVVFWDRILEHQKRVCLNQQIDEISLQILRLVLSIIYVT